MPSSGIISLLPVKAKSEEDLRRTLNRIGHDVRGGRLRAAGAARIRFAENPALHFARLALMDDPERGPGRKRLLLATDFDGEREAHLRALLETTSDPASVWGHCEGFSPGAGFAGLVLSHKVDAQAYYIAFRGDDLRRVRGWIARRGESLAPPVGRLPGWVRVLRALSAAGRFLMAGLTAVGMMFRFGPWNAWMAARRINATLDRVWWIRIFNRLTFNALPPLDHVYSEAPVDAGRECSAEVDGDEVVSSGAREGAPREDLISQNQLTLLTVVRPERLRRLRAVLAVIDLYATWLSTPGSLIGISTIHTVRWALVDGGRRLLMVSNYDNTWENYIDEFAEMILSGLDAIWENCLGYPGSGARDVAALKCFLRCHQVPANVFYSAYPNATVLNIKDGLGLAARSEETGA